MEKYKRVILYVLIGILAAVLLFLSAALINWRMEKRIYKLSYEECIKTYSQKYDLKKSMIAAVIFVESGWRADVESPKGARGLMQIMPDTGKWIAEKLEKDDFEIEKLYNGETNIEFGCWYLRYLLDKYEGNVKYALAAYNAGPGNLDNWLEDPRYSKDGYLQDIPFPQTREYITKVFSAMERYKEIYSDRLD